MVRSLPLVLLAAVAMLLVSCTAETPRTTEYGVTGAALTLQITKDPRITGFRLEIVPVDCGDGTPAGAAMTHDVGLEGFLPDGFPGFIKKPFDFGSSHVFGDLFLTLFAGCYDVTVAALADQEPADFCNPAHADRVPVTDGQTNEIMLLLQCEGPKVGALDTLATTNRPPTLVKLEYKPSKFVGTCEKAVFCATFADPNNDPLKIVWEKISGPGFGPYAFTQVIDGETVIACAKFHPFAAGEYTFKVTAYDMVWKDNAMITVEKYLELQGDPAESRDELTFPLHVHWTPMYVDGLCCHNLDEAPPD